MVFGIITLITALAIAGIAAWFSIAGLMVIFSAAAVPVAIMAGSLEIGKLVTASWLYRNWDSTKFLLKSYLTIAVVVLMFITSMGIFGYLSKAHIEQTAAAGDNTLKIQLLDQQIAREQKRIDDAELVVSQLDKSVQVLLDNDRIRGNNGAIAVRESQKEERASLNTIIDDAQTKVSTLQDEKLSLSQEQLAKEAEVGPLKYIAELIYGSEEAQSHFDEAVRWIIIILVVVFDPLAVALLIAANQTLRRHGINLEPEGKPHGDKLSELISNDSPDTADTAELVGSTAQPTGGAAEEGNNVQDSEPERDSTSSVLLQQSGATDNQPEINNQLADLEAQETQKKRSANSERKSPVSKKKITANRKKS
jgi:hypothetical protein